jgi:hypothetical protein
MRELTKHILERQHWKDKTFEDKCAVSRTLLTCILKQQIWEGLGRIHLAQDGKRRGVLADTVLNLLFPQEERNGLSSW